MSSGQSKPTALAFSSWAIVDDDGDDVLILNAFPASRPARLFRNESGVRRILAHQGRSVDDKDVLLIQELINMGVLESGITGERPEPHDSNTRRQSPFLGRLVLDAHLGERWALSVAEIRSFLARYAALHPHWRACIQLRPDISMQANLRHALAHGLRELVNGGIDCSLIEWRLRLSALPDVEHLAELLDEHGSLTVVVEDYPDAPDKERQADLMEQVAVVATQGFKVRPVLISRCDKSLVASVRLWQEVTEQAGVVVEPLVLETTADTLSPMDSLGEFEVASEVLGEIARGLGRGLLESEPWASILAASVAPGHIRWRWSKQVSGAYLSNEGQWATSLHHARAFLFATLSELFPHTYSAGGGVSERRLEDGGWPECRACAFGPICDSFWTPELDVLRKTGRTRRARLLAELHCAVRKDLLGTVLNEIRDDLREATATNRSLATFSGGKLSITQRS